MRMLIGSSLAALLAIGGLVAATVQANIGAHYAAATARAPGAASDPAHPTLLAYRMGAPAVYGWSSK